jgi:thiol-disulfide isomerase/thioredoxin
MIDRARPTRRLWTALVAIPAFALAGVGCATSAATQGGNGSITGTGSVITVPPSERDAPPNVVGETLDGQRLDVSDYRGKVVVMNYWASWCGPCRGEAPALVAAHARLGDDVPFVGLDRNGDSKANALAFKRTFGVTYPSLYDSDGSLLLAFNGAVPPTSLPSTVVLDTRGRVAAIVLGATTTTTLVELVHDVSAMS